MPSIASISAPTTLVRVSLYQHPPSSPYASSPPVPSANASAPESLAAAEEAPPSSPSTPTPFRSHSCPTYTELHPELEELDALPRLQTRKKPCK
ncbi:hypothetical protein FB446DRAFT_794021 [Lentinula raphanica]|nr:hypothetical protein FB446DRAFT_794021 [Lentinula raphanica]